MIKIEPLASVITSAYNSERTLAQTIESVLGQTYSNIEYIISDGASTDRTVEIAESYRPEFERKGYKYKIISSRDSGIYEGINKGLAQAHGIIVGNVNSDDYYEADMVQTAVECYLDSRYDLFYADLNIVDSGGTLLKIKRAKRMRRMITTRHWNHPTMFVPNRIYCRRKYDESYTYYADCDYMLWLYKNSSRITVVNRPLSNFRLGGASTQSSIKECMKRVKERYRGYRGNGYSRFYLAECLFMDIGKDLAMRRRKMNVTSFAKKIKRRTEAFFLKPHVAVTKKYKTRMTGSDYGGYMIVEKGLPKDPVVFSFGIGEDISFDLEMIERYHATVYAFDPTPRSVAFIEKTGTPENFHFYQYGLSDNEGLTDFFLPKNKNYVSASELTHYGVNERDSVKVPMKRLGNIMRELGCKKIDILKLDIEGSEFKIIDDLLNEAENISQICMEIHYFYFKDKKRKLYEFIEKLNSKGFVLCAKSDTVDVFTFYRQL